MKIVAVDGPAGSGKSSVCREVASRLGFGFLDTGAAYRALTWWALDLEVDVTNQADVARLLPDFPYTISLDPRREHIVVGEVEVTDAIRDSRISLAVSAIAENLDVRAWMREHARRVVAESGYVGVVAEGRDLTTVVFPDADARILLTAREEVRIARRAGEAPEHDVAQTVASVRDRDARDSAVAEFLSAAEGVSVIDSSDLTFEEAVVAVLDVVDREATS